MSVNVCRISVYKYLYFMSVNVCRISVYKLYFMSVNVCRVSVYKLYFLSVNVCRISVYKYLYFLSVNVCRISVYKYLYFLSVNVCRISVYKYLYFLSVNGTFLDAKLEESFTDTEQTEAFSVAITGTTSDAYSHHIYTEDNSTLVSYVYLINVALEQKVAVKDYAAIENIIKQAWATTDTGKYGIRLTVILCTIDLVYPVGITNPPPPLPSKLRYANLMFPFICAPIVIDLNL